MSSDFTTLKERVDIVNCIVGRTSGTTKNDGTDRLELSVCPFCTGHDCFKIIPSKQRYHCYQCPDDQPGGDVFDFVQRHDVCDKATALQKLAKEHGVELTKRAPEKVKRSPVEEKALDDQSAIFEEAANYYQACLFNTSRAIGYQRKVRMHKDATLKAFRVGYTDGRLYEHLKAKGYSEEQVIDVGLVKLKNGRLYDFFGHDLYIYPHLDQKNRVAGFTIKDRKKKYNYRLPGAHWKPNCIFYNMQAFKGKEIFLVEGENDLLSVYGRGGMQQVAAINGQISRAQLDYLSEWAPGKTIYLCFDNDKAGKGYTDRGCGALEKFCLPATLARLSQDQIADVRIVRFDPECNDIDEYLKGQGDPAAALEALMKGAERYFPPLLALKKLYTQRATDTDNKTKFNFEIYGEICFEWFHARGKFFVEGENCFLYFNKRIYQIGNNTPFKALLYKKAGINAALSGAKLLVQVIESQAYNIGEHTSTGGWLHTNMETNTIYFNLCDEASRLLRISPGKIEMVPNGTNGEQILLKKPPNMHPLFFNRDDSVRKGMERLKTHLFDNLTCNLADRYFVICLLINTVFIDYTQARGINRFAGSNSCGKTSGAALWSTVIMGENRVSIGTAASNYAEASASPLVIVDNLESDGVRNDQRDFLITTATGASRQTRKTGSDHENAYKRSVAQVVITAIESFVEPELIQRANEIVFDKEFFRSDFKEAKAVEVDIKRDRGLIWSSIFKIVAYDILPDIGSRKDAALKMIRKEYPKHAKARLNELYAMFYLILEEVTKYIIQPGYEDDPTAARWIFNSWISDQNKRAFATEAGSNKILYHLEALVKEYDLFQDSKRFEMNYGVKVEKLKDGAGGTEELTFTAATGELYGAFALLAKGKGTNNPFRSSSQLGSRITGSLETLKRGGWTFRRDAKIVRGTRKHQFVRVSKV